MAIELGAPNNITPIGGLFVRLINKTGAPSQKGCTVSLSSAGDNFFIKTVVGIPDCIGAVYDDGIADGNLCRVVISGIADVLFVGNTTSGNLARTFIATDPTADAGKALSEAVPSPPFATDKHFCEIGHVLDSRVGAGLARVNLHFN